jgi:steroid 5-alpha reductase family enzyme
VSLAALRLLGEGAILVTTVMAIVWLTAVRIRNAGIVDVAWSLNFSLLAGLYAWLGEGWPPRRALVATMFILWSLRLGVYLFVRIRDHHPAEDGRYRQLRRDWAPHADARFFAFFELQAGLNVLLSLPALLPCLNPTPALHSLEIGSLVLWAVALTGETLADLQLDRFRRDPGNHGHTCQVGLWRYSRHPNYFFEWLVWVAFFLFASASPWGWVTVYCPLLMLYFLYRVTGIPATEAQALRSRGEEYREYQRTTSPFVPLPRKV